MHVINRVMLFHIIDDEPIICAYVCELLQEIGHDVQIFLSPIDYLEHLKGSRYMKPTAIFTDISMPSMGGYEMIRRVQMDYPDQQFVIVSGKPEIRTELRDREEWLFLNKPFDGKSLYRIVERLGVQIAA